MPISFGQIFGQELGNIGGLTTLVDVMANMSFPGLAQNVDGN